MTNALRTALYREYGDPTQTYDLTLEQICQTLQMTVTTQEVDDILFQECVFERTDTGWRKIGIARPVKVRPAKAPKRLKGTRHSARYTLITQRSSIARDELIEILGPAYERNRCDAMMKRLKFRRGKVVDRSGRTVYGWLK